MKLLSSLLLAFLFIFSSCVTSKFVNSPLQGKYQDKPYVFESRQLFDKVWSNTIDFFAQNGVSITLIDKSSGLLVAGKTLFSGDYLSTEENGKLLKPSAYVVMNTCQVITGYDFKRVMPTRVEGDWNVRIKEENGKTTININLFNLRPELNPTDFANFNSYPTCQWEIKSTGIFEKRLANKFAGD